MEKIATIIVVALPLFVFYPLYWRYFSFRPDYLWHLRALAAGVAAASSVALIRNHLPAPITDGRFLEILTFVAAPEKLSLLFFLWISLRGAADDPAAVVAGAALAGLGFAAAENLLLAAGFNPVLLFRLLGATPLHMATAGLLGFGMLQWMLRRRKGLPAFFLTFAIALLLHAAFDASLHSSAASAAAAIAVVVVSLALLDFCLARAQATPSAEMLDALGVDLTSWAVFQRQFQCERWILRELLGSRAAYEPLFRWGLPLFRLTFALSLLTLPLLYLWNQSAGFFWLDKQYALAFQVQLPALLVSSLVLMGVFNRNYFRSGMLRAPIIMEARFPDRDSGARAVAYDAYWSGFFARTASPLGEGSLVKVRLQLGELESGEALCRVVFENHRNVKMPFGSILRFESGGFRLIWFLVRGAMQRMATGIQYVVRFPGYAVLRRLFLAPESITRDLRYLPAGAVVLREGDPAREFFMIWQGRIQVYRTMPTGHEVILAELGPGEILGEMAVAGQVPRNASARCIEDCVLSIASSDDLDSLVTRNPTFARQLLQTVAARAFASALSIDSDMNQLNQETTDARKWPRRILALALLGAQKEPLEGPVRLPVRTTSLRSFGIDRDQAIAALRAALHGQPFVLDSELLQILDELAIQILINRADV